MRNGFKNPLALIDFGLSKVFIDEDTGAILPEKKKVDFHGTFKYASIQAHEYHDQCQRDDLVSWVYSMVELVEGMLPWGNVVENSKMKSMKKSISAKELLRSFPKEFLAIYKYVTGLKYGMVPNYVYLRQLLLQSLTTAGIDPYSRFDWEFFSKEQLQNYSPISRLPSADDIELPEKQELIPVYETDVAHPKCTCLIL